MAEGLEEAEHSNSLLQEHKTSDCAEEAQKQQKGQELKLQIEREQRSANEGPASAMISSSLRSSSISHEASPALPPINPPRQVEEGEGASCYQCTLLGAATQTGVSLNKYNEDNFNLLYILLTVFLSITLCAPGETDASWCVEGSRGDSSASTTMLSNVEHSNERLNVPSQTEQQDKTTSQSEEEEVSTNISCECMKVKEKLLCEQHTGQLVKEVRSFLSTNTY